MALDSQLAEKPKYQESYARSKTHPEKAFEEYDRLNWPLTALLIVSHAVALYAVSKIINGETSWKILLFYFAYMNISFISLAAGVHRMWSHRAFKAKLPLRIFLMIFSTMALQGPIHIWARWHRQHHKFSDTAGDPHNPSRGFFFAHIGWIFMYDHQKFLNNSQNNIVTEDLENDGVVMWQYRNYYWVVPLTASLPIFIPWLMEWDNIFNTFAMTILCAVHMVHMTGLINSLAHSSLGSKPYDKYFAASRVKVLSLLAVGEGDHNYHHTFPWDYRSAEKATILNTSKYAIEFFNWVGLAYDLKTASPELIAQRANRTGDGSFQKDH